QHVTDLDAEFDALFRGHLRRVYEFAGVEAPSELEEPVIGEFRGVRPDAEPTAWISPTLDGELTDYFEWLPAGFVNRPTAGGAMHAGEPGAAAGPVEKLAYGFSPEKLFLRLDLSATLLDGNGRLRFTVNFTSPAEVRVRGEVRDGELGIKTRARGDEGGWADSDLAVEAAAGRVVELAVPLAGLGASEGGVIKLALDIEAEGGLERWPPKGYLELSIPEGGYEEDWIV
ncbi:MAG TPA: hypothetical protein VKA48_00185, partial [Gammaproteobacteria bacterium]|nr:hypothetical protein [Gammaproteobacteria bacterium]